MGEKLLYTMISTYAAHGGRVVGFPSSSTHRFPFQSAPRRWNSPSGSPPVVSFSRRTTRVMGHAPFPATIAGWDMCRPFSRTMRRYSLGSNFESRASMSSSHKNTWSYGRTTSGCKNRLAYHHLDCFDTETWTTSSLHGSITENASDAGSDDDAASDVDAEERNVRTSASTTSFCLTPTVSARRLRAIGASSAGEPSSLLGRRSVVRARIRGGMFRAGSSAPAAAHSGASVSASHV
eukprot:30154-Pelagococcus_subviridis.AAC.1